MRFLLPAFLLLFAPPAQARPVVVELFTSEACSSCPPAEALLGELKQSDPGILPLSLHVTYWNGPAWTDRFSLQAATDRQQWYAGLQSSNEIYTPEAVVDGGASMVGSNRADVTEAIASAKAAQVSIPIIINGGAMLKINIGGGAGGPAKIWLFGFDSSHTTQIGGGENGGVTLTEVNVVRSITPGGDWTASGETFTIPKPEGEHSVVLLQKADGRILGAAAD